MSFPKHLPVSTFCSDPNATYTVSAKSKQFGNGIFGYYKNEFDAYRVWKWLRVHGATDVVVEAYDPRAPVIPGMHPYVEQSLGEYS